jgi:hypothetical protein
LTLFQWTVRRANQAKVRTGCRSVVRGVAAAWGTAGGPTAPVPRLRGGEEDVAGVASVHGIGGPAGRIDAAGEVDVAEQRQVDEPQVAQSRGDPPGEAVEVGVESGWDRATRR